MHMGSNSSKFFKNKYNRMKSFLGLLIFLSFLVSFLTSCEKENVDIIVIEEPDYDPEEVIFNSLLQRVKTDNPLGTAMMNCVTLEYPFTLELKSGNKAIINSKEEWTLVLDGSVNDKPVDFVFPLDILDASGNKLKINSNVELGKDFASCIPQRGWTAAMTSNETVPACLYGGLFCFDVVYPLTLTDENGNIRNVNSEVALIDVFAQTQSALSFVLPISVVNNDNGNQSTIQNLDDFWNAIGQCKDVTPVVTTDGFVFQGFVCFDLVYPTQMLDINGNTITVNTAEEYALLVLGGEPLRLIYPFSLKDDNGSTTIVTNLTSFILALNGCGKFDIEIEVSETCNAPDHVLLFINRGGAALSPCRFDINYPVKLLAGGSEFTVNNIVEYYEVYNAFELNEITVQFPVSVKVNQTGQVIEFPAKKDVCIYIDECN